MPPRPQLRNSVQSVTNPEISPADLVCKRLCPFHKPGGFWLSSAHVRSHECRNDREMTEQRHTRGPDLDGWKSPAAWIKSQGFSRALTVFVGALLFLVLFWGAVALQRVSPCGSAFNKILGADRIYNPGNVQTVHLKFVPGRWEAMEPKGGGNRYLGGPQGGRPGEGRGANGDRSLAQVFMTQGDFDRDVRISQHEFAGLAERWFKAWDTNGAGIENDLPQTASFWPLTVRRRSVWSSRIPPDSNRSRWQRSSQKVGPAQKTIRWPHESEAQPRTGRRLHWPMASSLSGTKPR